MAAGQELVLHVGHGTEGGWPGSMGDDELPRLDSSPPAILVSVGCSTAVIATQAPYQAYLDVEGRDHRGTNDAETFQAPPAPPAPIQPARYGHSSFGVRSLLAKSGGAIAYIGCDTGAQPCALAFIDGVTDALALPREESSRLGDVWNAAVRHYHTTWKLATLQPTADWYPASIFFQAMKFVVLGDPSLPMP
jgi:hypothetical protein